MEIKPAIPDENGLGNFEEFGRIIKGESSKLSPASNKIYYYAVCDIAYQHDWKIKSEEFRDGYLYVYGQKTTQLKEGCSDVKVTFEKNGKEHIVVFYIPEGYEDKPHTWYHRGTISILRKLVLLPFLSS